jgi:signal transduction histidine kinase
MLANLVSNAMKYSPPGSPVQLSVQADPHAVVASLCFWVTNSVGSAGRPDAFKVFARYYRGLGLWLAHTIALKMGSQLHCCSDDSTVNFYFSLELC